MRRALLLGFLVATGPGCLCLQTPESHPAENDTGGGGSGALPPPIVGSTPDAGPSPIVEACVVLGADGQDMGLEDDGAGDDASPALIALDQKTVGVVFSSTATEGDPQLRFAEFAGWDAWPLASSATDTVMQDKNPLGVASFTAAPSSTGDFALFYRASAGGLFASEHVFGPSLGATRAVDGDTPLFIQSSSSDAALVGYTSMLTEPGIGRVYRLGIAVDVSDGLAFESGTVACSRTPILGAAAPVRGATLFAATIGQSTISVDPHNDSCRGVDDAVAASDVVALATVTKLGASVSPGSMLDMQGLVDGLALAPTASGSAWLVVGSGGVLFFGSVSPQGGTAIPPPLPIPADLILDSRTFAATSLGETLIVAAGGTDANGDPAISVAVGGDPPVWTPAMSAPGLVLGSPLSILGNGSSEVLVAWAGDSSGARRIHIARFSCRH